MGKVKIRIRRLETVNLRQATYSKRKSGLMKKARELATLCDVDLAVLTFSPSTGRPSFFTGERSSFAEIVERLSKISIEDVAQRKQESLKLLERMYKNHEEHEVDVRMFSDNVEERAEQLQNEVAHLNIEIAEKIHELSSWANPEDVDDIMKLKEMENKLFDSLTQLRTRMEKFFEKHSCKAYQPSRAHRVDWLPLDRLLQYHNNLELLQRNLGYPTSPVEQIGQRDGVASINNGGFNSTEADH